MEMESPSSLSNSMILVDPFLMIHKVLRLCLFILAAAASGAHYETIVVDQSGHGNFTSIQAAIDFVPGGNLHWICIRIRAGTYREKVKIPYEKPFMILKGKGKRKTQVVWDDHDNVAQSPTFSSLADNVVVRSMSFRNSYNNKNVPRVPAVAAMISGDKSAFYRCGFFGVQDTLWDEQGRHYYYKCTIQGVVDFIFGAAQSIFESCGISVVGEALPQGLVGFITAQGRTGPNDADGFVFKSCVVYGSGSSFLGRPWRSYSRVLFYNSTFSSVVHPEGWAASSFSGNESRLTFAEHSCNGEGADTSKRVRWEKKLSDEDLKEMTSINFINSEGWLKNQPI